LSQQKEDFLSCIVHALDYYGSVPKVLVPDNLKSGVAKAGRDEADINTDLLDLGNHYGMAILPTRSRKPRDKAWVERMVQIVYTRIFAPLRKEVFTHLDALNEAILELLEEHNNQPCNYAQKAVGSSLRHRKWPACSPCLWRGMNSKRT
jgi:transposase